MSTKAYVNHLPDCDIHKYDLGTPGIPAKYDAKTKRGPWASMCQPCWVANAASPNLGTGIGQEYVLQELRPARNVQADVLAAVHAGDMDAAWEAVGDGDPADYFG
jgi:hypothetical protein